MPTKSKPVLIVGGAGYIGSHMVLTLKREGYEPIVLDNLSKGHKESVIDAELIIGDMADTELLKHLFAKYSFAAVMHFASFIEVHESLKFPVKYYQNNVTATLNLIDVMLQNNVKNFIFSSSASVYGQPQAKLINEAHVLAPITPYGRSKWMVEEMVKDLAKSDGLNFAILRYFNAAGADVEGRLFEFHQPESHLIPLVLQAAAGRISHVAINGNQYATPDGTCIRDYVHVVDLCHAHLLALNAMDKGRNHMIYNLGTGNGYSVTQVINAARKVTGKNIPTVIGPTRAGDPPSLVSDPSLIKQELNWQPKYSELETIIEHAWKGVKCH